MVNAQSVRRLALSFPDTIEVPHFELASFRVNKKIFATFDERKRRAMLKLSQAGQYVFCAYDWMVFFPVPGKWGKGGSTYVDLKKVKSVVFKEALTNAYRQALDKKSPGSKTKQK